MLFKGFCFSLSAVPVGVLCVFVTTLTNKFKMTLFLKGLFVATSTSKTEFKFILRKKYLPHVLLLSNHFVRRTEKVSNVLAAWKKTMVTLCIKVLVVSMN